MKKSLYIFFIIFITICISQVSMACSSKYEKIIYSHVGHNDKTLWPIQLSYLSFGDLYSKDNHFFWYGLSALDSIQPVNCFQINENSFQELKRIILESDYRAFNSLSSRAYGNFCISIIQNNKINRFFLSRDELLELIEKQLIIIENDKNGKEPYGYFQELKETLGNY